MDFKPDITQHPLGKLNGRDLPKTACVEGRKWVNTAIPVFVKAVADQALNGKDTSWEGSVPAKADRPMVRYKKYTDSTSWTGPDQA